MVSVEDGEFRRHAKDVKRHTSESESGFARFGKAARLWIAGVATAAFLSLRAAIKGAVTEIDAAYSSIARNSGATGAQLAGLQQSFQNVFRTVPESADQVARAIGDLNTRLGLTGRALEDASRSVLAFSRVTGSNLGSVTRLTGQLMAAMNIEASDLEFTLDKLTHASQTSGIGVESLMATIVDSVPTLDQLGYGLNEAIALFSEFERVGAEPRTAVMGLNRMLASFAQEGVTDARVAFDMFLRSIEEAPTEMAATGIAAEYFGTRVGSQMAQRIKDGVFSVNDFAESLDWMQGKLAETADTSRTLAERLALLRNAFTSILNERIGGAVEGFAAALDRVNENAGTTIRLLIRLAEVIGIVALGYGAIRAVVIGFHAAMAAGRTILLTYQTAVLLLTAAKARLTGNITLARNAMIAFSMAVRANPIGILLTVITAAGAAWLTFRRRADEATDALKRQREETERLRREIGQMGGAVLRVNQIEVDRARAANEQRLRELERRRDAIGDYSPMLGSQMGQAASQRARSEALEVEKEIAAIRRNNITLSETEALIGARLRTSAQARLDYLISHRDMLVEAGAKTQDLARVNRTILELQRQMQDLREHGTSSGSPIDPEDAAKALEAFERIRRAVEIAQAGTEEWREALAEVFRTTDQIAALEAALPGLSGSQRQEATEMLTTLREQLENARERVAAEEGAAEAFRRAAEGANEFVAAVMAMPLERLTGAGLAAEDARTKMQEAATAVGVYERTVTRLRNELDAGIMSQDEFAAAMEAANEEALQTLQALYEALSGTLGMTPELEKAFSRFFAVLRGEAEDTRIEVIDLATSLQNIGSSVRSMTRLVDVFGDLNREARMLLDGLADLADNAGRFAATWSRLGDARGSAGGILQLAVPGIGMMAGLASTIGGLIQANRESKREMERLSQSLRDAARDIRESISEMRADATIGEDVSRDDVDRAQRAADQLTRGQYTGLEGAMQRLRAMEATGIDFLQGISDSVTDQFQLLMKENIWEVGTGRISADDLLQQAIDTVFAEQGIMGGLSFLGESLGQYGASIAGGARMFDQLVKAGVSVEDAWQEVGTFLQKNVAEIPDVLSDWLGDLMQMDVDSDEFREAVQEMLRASMEGGFDLEGMTPRAFNDLIDFLLGLPGRIDPQAIEEGASALEEAFNRFRIRQQYTDADPQEAITEFLGELLDLGDELTPTLRAELQNLFQSVDLSTEDGAQALLDWVERAGRGLAAGTLDLGEMDESEFEAILQIFQNLALGVEDVFEGVEDVFKNGVDGAVQALNILTRYMGVDAPEALAKFTQMLLATSDTPEVARDLVAEAAALDVTTAEGRARLQEIIAAIGALMLNAEGADREALQSIADGLQNVLSMPQDAGEDRTSRSVQYLRSITEFQGQEIVLTLSALEHWARQQTGHLETIASHTAALAGLEAAVQAAMSGAMPELDAGVMQQITSSRTISVQIGDITRPLRDPDDIDYLVDAIADELRREMTRAY